MKGLKNMLYSIKSANPKCGVAYLNTESNGDIMFHSHTFYYQSKKCAH